MSLINPVPQQIKAWEFPQLLISNHPLPLSVSSKESKPKKKNENPKLFHRKIKARQQAFIPLLPGFPIHRTKKKWTKNLGEIRSHETKYLAPIVFSSSQSWEGGRSWEWDIIPPILQCNAQKEKANNAIIFPFLFFCFVEERERTVVVFRPHKKLLFFGRGNANEKNKSRAQEWKK